ncbi:MAG: heavy metal translocating P-type ATPase [Ruminococcaceae bacterium]|nr:heavy metal translocating P-type ATPase [Oscillospiraceae bacterium]
MKTERYKISGMSCAACSASVMRVVSRLNGVSTCDVNLVTGIMTVLFDEQSVCESDFKRVVEKAGFGIEKDEEKKQKKAVKAEKESIIPVLTSAVFSAVLLYISMGQMLFENIPLPAVIDMEKQPFNFALTQLLLCLPALFFGRKFFTNGIPLLFKGHPNMDSLVALGAGASLVYSIVMTYTISGNPHAVHNLYYESVAVVITLVMLGKFLERRSRKKTLAAIEKLMELSPEYAVVLRENIQKLVPLEEVKKGEILVVKAGEKIPLDAIVCDGECECNEAMLTGESMPVAKHKGDRVIGGSINLNGLIYAEVQNIGDDTTLAKIIRFVEEAQGKKAPISKTADAVAGIFVPVVTVIAVLSAVLWFIFQRDIAFSLKIFTSVLVVACPCALGLATPTAIMVGTGLGAQNGILIKNGEVLEITHKIKAIAFDKTGTVTVGKPVVTDVISSDSERLLKYAVLAESGSSHPLAKAILQFANAEEIKGAEGFQNLVGKGVKCVYENKEILLGSALLLEENGLKTKAYQKDAERLSSEGKTVIFVAYGNEVLGILATFDQLKPSAKEAFENLRKMGIKTVLLSGDNKLCAENTARLLSADEVYSEVLPNRKAQIISEIRKKYGRVMMIGDGINDAPALSAADVGCAVGDGSDIAIESADIVLMKNDPCDAARVINLSRMTIKNIKQNLFWAFCYNSVCIPIAAGVLHIFSGPLLSPMLGGLAMSLSSVFVVGNALRLRGKKL